jgi:hypothetical protein
MPRRRFAITMGIALAGALLVGQTASVSASPVRFGNTLKNGDGSVKQPANSPRKCDNTGPHEGEPCTMVSVITSNFGHEKAPKDGKINKVRTVSLHSGSFRLYFAKAHPGSQEAKVVKKGPVVNYSGDNVGDYSIDVNTIDPISVKKGWYIAIKDTSFDTVSCTSGSAAQLEFQPPLAVGGSYETADDTNGCYMLVELQYQ